MEFFNQTVNINTIVFYIAFKMYNIVTLGWHIVHNMLASPNPRGKAHTVQ